MRVIRIRSSGDASQLDHLGAEPDVTPVHLGPFAGGERTDHNAYAAVLAALFGISAGTLVLS